MVPPGVRGRRGLTFPLVSDFEPKGVVPRMYDAYPSQDGFSERALFVLDPEGRIEWREVVPPEENPGADGILQRAGRHDRAQRVVTSATARRPRSRG